MMQMGPAMCCYSNACIYKLSVHMLYYNAVQYM